MSPLFRKNSIPKVYLMTPASIYFNDECNQTNNKAGAYLYAFYQGRRLYGALSFHLFWRI